MAVEIKKINGVYMGSQEIASTRFAGDANLVGYWRLEDVNDSGPNGYNLTNNGTATFVAGKFSNAVSLNGSSQYLSIADASCANLELSGSRSISAWVKTTSAGVIAVVGKRGTDYAVNAGYLLYLASGAVHFTVDGLTTNTDVTSVATVNNSVWNHIVGVYNGSNLLVYVNGVLSNSAVATGTGASSNSWPFCIGCDNQGAGNTAGLFFPGLIDDVSIFSRALTSDEIYSLYKTGVKKLGGSYTPPQELSRSTMIGDANLQGYWKLEDVNDSSANGYNLTNNNTVTFTSGKFNNAGNFNGSNQYLSITDASCPNLEISGSQTWIANFKIDSFPTGTACVLAKRSNYGGGKAKQLHFGGNGVVGFTLLGLSAGITSDVVLKTNRWYFIVGRYNSSTNKLSIFINGVNKEISVTGTPNDTDGAFCIGGQTESGEYFDGLIDDCAIFNRALSDDEISYLYSFESEKNNGVYNVSQELENNPLRSDTSLLAYYRMDETSGTETIDERGIYHGTISGATVNQVGKFNKSYLFSNASVTKVTSTITTDQTISISGWIKTLSPTLGSYQIPFMKGITADNCINLILYNSTYMIGTINSSTSATGAIVDGNWNHAVIIRNGTNVQLYINAVKVIDATLNTGTHSADFILGVRGDNNGDKFNGYIDDVAIFSRVLTATEISNLYNTNIKKYNQISNV